MLLPIGYLSQYIFGSLLFILSFLIIAIILLQRGRGGGLTGALGGAGGQSAFGVKAGDIFTRITAVLVLLWIFTCALAARWYKESGPDIKADTSSGVPTAPASSGMGAAQGFDPSSLGLPLSPDKLESLTTPPSATTPSATTPSDNPPPEPGSLPPTPTLPPSNSPADTPSATNPEKPSAEPATVPPDSPNP